MFNKNTHVLNQHIENDWALYNGDSINVMDGIPDDSVGLSIYSPPFPGMYVYSNTVHDIGNNIDVDEMIEHFRFLVNKDKLLRVTMPGRLTCVHLMQLQAFISRDGYMGIKDYRGKTIQMMIDEGWIYKGEVCIDKNPQLQAIRNKEHQLQFRSLAKDSANMRTALADYMLYFQKPGDNPEPIKAGISPKYNPDGGGWITEEEWIRWAAPVWPAYDVAPGTSFSDYMLPVWYRLTKDNPHGIHEGDVLNVVQARETDDERHLCPLQLGVIERAIKIWSAPGDVVFSPFAGIGSEGYQAIKYGRKFIGVELKESYYRSAIGNLRRAEQEKAASEMNLFSFAGLELA